MYQFISFRFMTLLCSIFLLSLGCSRQNSGNLAENSTAGTLISQSACKQDQTQNAKQSSSEDCLRYTYSDNILNITHVNSAFNCCANIQGKVEIRGGTITIRESEMLQNGGCHCLCLYDVEYVINQLTPGTYRIKFSQLHLSSTAAPLSATIDLAASSSGEVCVTRSNYPWGI